MKTSLSKKPKRQALRGIILEGLKSGQLRTASAKLIVLTAALAKSTGLGQMHVSMGMEKSAA